MKTINLSINQSINQPIKQTNKQNNQTYYTTPTTKTKRKEMILTLFIRQTCMDLNCIEKSKM